MKPSDHDEAKWHAEFEKRGAQAVHDALYRGRGLYSNAQRQCGLRWLRKKETDLDRDAAWYLKWTFRAAVATAIVGFAGIIVTLVR
jgi:hypothetical protein